MKELIKSGLLAIAVILMASSCYNEDNRILESCEDGILNQDEERIDCGGPNCEPCPPSCDNGILDYVDGWQEVGIDCGGPCAELGQLCCENGIQDENEFDPTLSENWVDCKYDGLLPGDPGSNSECPICEECANGIQDGAETGIDCDDDPMTECEDCIELCDDGLLNGGEGPCVDCGGSCPTCSTAHCEDGVLSTFANDPSRNETAIDCGGCACPPCLLLCNDGIQNGNEEAIDCGGDDCVNCLDAVLCGDGVQNGYETGVDCYDGTEVPPPSACPTCNTLCSNGLQDGQETDTDCGGVDCGPCGNEEVGFITYNVDGIFYESNFTAHSGLRVEGNATTPDAIIIGGGINHPMTITINDDDLTPMQFGTIEAVISNQQIPAGVIGSMQFTDVDGVAYTAEQHVSGVTVDVTSVTFTAPVMGIPTGFVEANFSGTMIDVLSGETISITDGQLKIFFLN